MNYSIRTLHNGRVYEAFTREYDAAVLVFEALFDQGLRPELWQGSTKLR